MKYIILVGLLIGQLATAACNIKSASSLVNERTVGPVTNLIKKYANDKCTVHYRINVNGEWHQVAGEAKGYENESMLCYYAVERSKRDFLLELGGEFKTESITVCNEGARPAEKVKIGDVVLENELRESPIKKYFNYKGSRCKLFQEQYIVEKTGKLLNYNGVICQMNDSDANWLVIDMW